MSIQSIPCMCCWGKGPTLHGESEAAGNFCRFDLLGWYVRLLAGRALLCTPRQNRVQFKGKDPTLGSPRLVPGGNFCRFDLLGWYVKLLVGRALLCTPPGALHKAKLG